MAGTYPDVPGHRFMYDQDGTIFSLSAVGGGAPYTVTDPLLLNDEDTSDTPWDPGFSQLRDYVFAFPEARNITGLFLLYTLTPLALSSVTMTYSTDTTDGSDGTWTSFGSVAAGASVNLSLARTGILPLNLPGVKGLRIRSASTNSNPRNALAAVHIYGTIPVTGNPDRLEFWQPSADSVFNKAGLDFGDLPLGSVATKQFRVKNLSSSKTAGSTVVSANNAAGGSANTAMISGLQFSLDGVAYSSTITLPTLAPGAVSQVLYVRRTVLPNEAPETRFARVLAIPTTFA